MSSMSTIKRALDDRRLPLMKKYRRGQAVSERLSQMSPFALEALGADKVNAMIAQVNNGMRARRTAMKRAIAGLRSRGGA